MAQQPQGQRALTVSGWSSPSSPQPVHFCFLLPPSPPPPSWRGPGPARVSSAQEPLAVLFGQLVLVRRCAGRPAAPGGADGECSGPCPKPGGHSAHTVCFWLSQISFRHLLPGRRDTPKCPPQGPIRVCSTWWKVEQILPSQAKTVVDGPLQDQVRSSAASDWCSRLTCRTGGLDGPGLPQGREGRASPAPWSPSPALLPFSSALLIPRAAAYPALGFGPEESC